MTAILIITSNAYKVHISTNKVLKVLSIILYIVTEE